MTRKLLGLILLLVSLNSFSQPFHNEWIDYNKTYYKFKVGAFGSDGISPISNGMVRIPYATIAANGLSGTPAEQFQLWRDGEEVPVYVSKTSGSLGSADYIEFWGEMNNGKLDKELYRSEEFQLNGKWSLQTDTASYFLTVNPGTNKRLMDVANNVGTNTLAPTPYFMNTVGRYFRNELLNGYSAVVGQNLYSSSYDMGEGFVSRQVRPNTNTCDGGGGKQLPQSFTNLNVYTAGPSARLNINSVGNAANSRSVSVSLNGDPITAYQMDYFYDSKVEEYIPVNKLASNSAAFIFINQSTAGCDEFRIATIELTYPRTFDMTGASNFSLNLEPSASGRYIEFTNFNKGGVLPVIYDLANGKRYVGDTTQAGKVRVALEPSTVPYKLVLSTQSGTYYKAITQLQKRNFINYGSVANQGDYLIISNPIIYGSGANNSVEQYRQYRTSEQGGKYVAQVVDINELVDQFAWGIKKHPLSIKNFLKYARAGFSIKPRYVFLIGKGVTYTEYRSNESNALVEQLNLVPTFGYPASDNLLSSNNENAIPLTPIGRLSAVTAQEVADYLQKVKQYDSAQQSSSNTIKDKGWMKNVLQIAGANDIGLGKQLDGYLEGYKNIIQDSAFGARVKNYSKTGDPANYSDAVISFKNTYESGASLITYFGHSSATSLDFNLDNPENYNNHLKYPVFIANGCSAGNHFGFETNRFGNKSTISEKFVLANQRGAIGYLSSTYFGIPNYLDMFTRAFYTAFTKTKYNMPVGDAIKEGITKVLDSTGMFDYYARVHAEEFAYHGDPAIKLNATDLPDLVIEEPEIETAPSFISVADTSFNVKVRINNIGRASTDSVNFKLERILPNGKTEVVLIKRIRPVTLIDSVLVNIPIVENRDKGFNVLTASIDFDNKVAEITDINNTSSKTIQISEDEIRPVFPYAFSIISQQDVKLAASTVNPLNVSREYVMQLDTTELFNSPIKIEKRKTSVGGVIEFEPGVTYVNGRTYYWRVSPSLAQPNWRVSSFTYKDGAGAGFQQAHMYQNFKSQLSGIAYDSANGKYSFTPKVHNLFITHGIYPYSGLEDGHFSISVDGTSSIRSACIGSSVIINVFDPVSFEPWKNTTNPFGAAAPCNTGREYNFEYSYRDASTRKNAMDFLDAVPKGAFVAVRLVLDDPYNLWAKDWAKDTSIYGKNNSLYHRLKSFGLAQMDSFYFPRNFALIFKKGDTTFAPVYKLSDGLYDRLTLSQNCVTPNTKATITSPKFGPAKAWKKLTWQGYSDDGKDVPTVDILGITKDNKEELVYSIDSTQHQFSLADVDPVRYRYIKLRLNNKDTINATPYQLTSWNIEYDAAAEGGIAPNLYFNIPDTIGGTTGRRSDILPVAVAYKNVSKVNFDSLAVKIVLYDTLNNVMEVPLVKTRPLAAGDTLHIDMPVNVSSLQGLYNVYVQVNPGGAHVEQESFNNFFYKYVYITPLTALPVTLTDFNATLAGNDVKTTWTVTEETNIQQYTVQHSLNGISFNSIGTIKAANRSSVSNYEFVHVNAPNGKNYYRLVVADKDGSSKLSQVKMVTITKGVSLSIYPNPVKDKLTVVLKTADGKPGTVILLNSSGQHLLQKTVNGTISIDMSKYASGSYLLQVDDGSRISTHKIQKQ